MTTENKAPLTAGSDQFEALVSRWQQRVENALRQRFDAFNASQRGMTHLAEAMRHTVFAESKHLRPALVYAASDLIVGEDKSLAPALDCAACALEVLHSYSLIHDDLPSMDDDDWRRGRPASHIVFGEGLAILAGDALHALAFEWMASVPAEPDTVVELLKNLAFASGWQGMTGGQAIDILSEQERVSPPDLIVMHQLKTGALITAAVVSGGLLSGASERELSILSEYGRCVGLAFQLRDDALDADVSGEAAADSRFRSDERMETAQVWAKRAVEAVADFGSRASVLNALAEFAVHRSR